MTFEEYQKEAVKFRCETANNEEYLTLGLIAEVGEAAGKLAKRRRDGMWDEKAFIKELGDILWFVSNLAEYYDRENDDTNYLKQLKDSFDGETHSLLTELEDMVSAISWASDVVEGFDYLPNLVFDIGCLADRYGYTLEQVAEINIAKLRDRAARGVIKGNGDER